MGILNGGALSVGTRRFFISSVVLLFSCSAGSIHASGGKYSDPKRFEGSIREFETEDKRQPPPRGAVLCVGSSSMGHWRHTIKEDLSPLTIIPRGFGGSTMNDVLFYADRIVTPYKPRAIVLYEGDNDIAHDGVSPEKFRDTFLAFVEKVRRELPGTRVYFISIKPSPSRWWAWPKMRKANALIKKICDENELLTYVDVASAMLRSDGGGVSEKFYGKDRLHMNREGYLLWRKILRPVLMRSESRFEKQASACGRSRRLAGGIESD